MKKKKNFKIISIITTLFVITTLVSLKGLIVNATGSDKPEFTIEISAPETGEIGKPVYIQGRIIPKKLEIPVPTKEIVFVVDIDALNNGKLSSLMSETKNFISKISGNSNFQNVKIGIVTYEKEAEIKKVNGTAFLDLKNNSDIIESTLSGLKNSGNKTNTGEGLRKALYLLNSKEESVQDANKTIIFISDSIPTARTVYSKNSGQEGVFYTDINNYNYDDKIVTTGNSSDSNKDLEYAKTMAKLVNDKGYNVFTIGYGLDKNSQGLPALKEIHQVMSGNDMGNSSNDENNGFFISNDKDSAAKAFSDIANKVLQNYSLINVDMNINFSGNFSLNIDGNTIDLNNINYELKSINNGKAIYEAAPIEFKFSISGNTEGYQKILDKVTIVYPWKGSIEKIDINKELYINMKSNKLPIIEARLSSDKLVHYSDENIDVIYKIIPNEFDYIGNTNNTQKKEVTFIIDTSSDMESLDKVKNALINRITNYFINKKDNIKFNIIMYNNEINEYIVDPNAKDNNGVLINYQSEIQNKINSIQKSSSKEKKLGEALKRADKIFAESGDSDSLKNIIIIAAGDPTDNFPNINKNSYNIITLALNKIDNYNNPEENYNNPYETLKEWHNLLGGKENNYFISAKRSGNNDIDSGTEIANKNPLAPEGDIMAVIAKRIEENRDVSYKFDDITINFDLASNFDVISGLQKEGESNYSLKLPEVVYTPKQQIDDNYYKYEAKPIEISFTIKPKEGKMGELKFSENSAVLKNYISYITLVEGIKKAGIETPSVMVEEKLNISNLNHGLYNGKDDKSFLIQEMNGDNYFQIAQGSTVTFGANFTCSGKVEFKLNVDEYIQGIDKNSIKIYKILNGELENIEDKKISGENNEFNLSISVDNDTEILVVYQGKIKEDTPSGQPLINDIVFGNTSKSVTIMTSNPLNNSPILPDLF